MFAVVLRKKTLSEKVLRAFECSINNRLKNELIQTAIWLIYSIADYSVLVLYQL